MKKLFKILYYIFFAAIIIIALGVIAPLLPIPGNYQILTVLSGSMELAIRTGSVVAVKPADDYKIGDIITFGESARTKTPTTHRIHDMKIQEGNPIYMTKGDANNAPDSKEITNKDIIGKVLFSVPYAGYAIDTARKPWGFALIIIVPAAVLVGDEFRKIWKEAQRIRNKKISKLEKNEEENGDN